MVYIVGTMKHCDITQERTGPSRSVCIASDKLPSLVTRSISSQRGSKWYVITCSEYCTYSHAKLNNNLWNQFLSMNLEMRSLHFQDILDNNVG